MNTARPLLEFLQCCSVASHTWEMAILKDFQFQLLLIKLIIILRPEGSLHVEAKIARTKGVAVVIAERALVRVFALDCDTQLAF